MPEPVEASLARLEERVAILPEIRAEVHDIRKALEEKYVTSKSLNERLEPLSKRLSVLEKALTFGVGATVLAMLNSVYKWVLL